MNENINEPLIEDVEETNSCCSSTTCCPPATVTRATPKIGRNDPCFCGSKIKFKKCCGKN